MRHLVRAFLLSLAVTGCDVLLSSPLPVGRVRVETRSRLGDPLPGITVLLYVGYRPMSYAQTDSRGRAVFDGVPEGNYGVYLTLSDAYARWDEVAGLPHREVVDRIPVSAGSDTLIRFEFLQRGMGSIRVRNVDPDGGPIVGNLITLYQWTGDVMSRATDSVGVAEFPEVPLGNYGVRSAIPPELQTPGGPAITFRDGLLIDKGFRQEVELTTPWCAGRLSVRVLDGENQGVPGALLTLYVGDLILRREHTGATGTITWSDIRCGDYGVFVEPPRGYRSPWARDTAFTDGIKITKAGTAQATLRVFRDP